MMGPDWLVLKDFIDLSDDKSLLCQTLDDNLLEDLESFPTPSSNPSKGLLSKKERINQVHYSWFIPFFDRMKDCDKYLFLNVFDENHQTSLKEYYDLSRSPKELSSLGENYALSVLETALKKDNINPLPLSCLPKDPLNQLLNLTREQLLTLVDYLSMHDLSLELKTMISSSHLKNIRTILPNHQKQYLNKLLQKIEPISFKPMGLCHWDGNEAKLKKILHQRGLNRLSKALALSNHSLLWHLTHKLDIGRASIVKSLLKDVKNQKAQKVLISQVCDIIDKVH